MKRRFGKAKKHVVGKANPWILDVLDDQSLNELNNNRDVWTTRQTDASLCVACKGSRMLCGKTRCPVMVRVNSFIRAMPLIKSLDIDGSSPPSVFVGRVGYPYVYAGPMVPPIHEDTSLYDSPELWFGKTIDEIVSFRSMLIRGKYRVHVRRIKEAGKIMDLTRELALASAATDVELALKKRPRGFLVLNDDVQPFGPSAPIRDLRVDSARWDHHVEKAYYDTDLKAKPAVLELYDKNVMVTRIQRAFSVGAFGVEKQRRLVPTRWSITAVDSMISKELMNKVKTFPLIDEYHLFESSYLDNQFEVLMMPDVWSYEAIEAWYPGTVWNPSGKYVVMYGDWEGFDGRTTYADIGGCYYAARLAVCEYLMKERRQATVIVLREARPGYIMPVGVWQVRENVRNAMRQRPLKFATLEQALQRISSRFNIPIQRWIDRSKLIMNAKIQRKITQYA
ncbi:MAG: Nre family DNA repair protein [Candidatus Bathyarchaeota archaeon]|nr:Nre family DNA repair protein [Candidatus Bathyarchaeota archaeon]